MDEREVLLKIIDDCLDKNNRIKTNSLKLDPGFIVAEIGNKRFVINVQEDSF